MMLNDPAGSFCLPIYEDGQSLDHARLMNWKSIALPSLSRSAAALASCSVANAYGTSTMIVVFMPAATPLPQWNRRCGGFAGCGQVMRTSGTAVNQTRL
jgi:hypothetical protein